MVFDKDKSLVQIHRLPETVSLKWVRESKPKPLVVEPVKSEKPQPTPEAATKAADGETKTTPLKRKGSPDGSQASKRAKDTGDAGPAGSAQASLQDDLAVSSSSSGSDDE